MRLTTDSDHGSWTFAVDLPSPDHHRTTIRRGGFPTQDAARSALRRMLEGEAGGFTADPNQTVADYLTTWLEAKAYVLKPTTVARYRDYVTHDLIPALGALKLDELGHRHIAAYAHTQLKSGRGPVTIHRCLATCPAPWATPSGNTAWLTTPHGPLSSPAPPHPNDASGHPRKRSASWATAMTPTRSSPTCANSSSAPACAKAKRSACTGRVVTGTPSKIVRGAPG
ncbi:hypothetical protein ACEYXF_10185 [Streptomyces asiaticus]|uniref:hypothetical protein n=1 Tax=Streptomyces asiaticus TaxID=114695 RepID=UPI0039BE5AC5